MKSANEQIIRSNVPKMAVDIHLTKLFTEARDIARLHYHEEIELLRIYEGELFAVIDDVEYSAKPGDVIFINSGVPHSTHSKGRYRYGLIQFKESDFQNSEISRTIKYSMRLINLQEVSARVIRSEELYRITGEIIKEKLEGREAYEMYIRGGIYSLLGCLYREGVLKNAERVFNTKDMQKIAPVLDYINKHYEEEITLESASALLGFDQSYFCRIFKAASGSTFTEYLNFVRICRAEKLLARTGMSILEISEAVGFSSVSYFNRIFKRFRKCSPRYYRTAQYANI